MIFDIAPNAYFHGTDLRVGREDGGEWITVNVKDGMPAIEVKDHAPLNARDEDIELIGEDFANGIYEGAQESWWEQAEEHAREHGFSKLYSAGRSGGWACVDADPGFLSDLNEPNEERDRFFALGFTLIAEIAHTREFVVERIHEEAEEIRRTERHNALALKVWRD